MDLPNPSDTHKKHQGYQASAYENESVVFKNKPSQLFLRVRRTVSKQTHTKQQKAINAISRTKL